MPRVRYLSGNATGRIVEVSETEAQNLVATGFAEVVAEPPAAPAETPRARATRPRSTEETEPRPSRRE